MRRLNRSVWSAVWLPCWLLALALPLQVRAADDPKGGGKGDSGLSRPFHILCSLAWRPDDNLTAALLSPDGASLLTAACDVNHSAGVDPHSTPEEVLSPRINIGGRFPEVILWDAATGKQLHVFKGHRTPVRVLAFDPNGRSVASGGAEDYVADHLITEFPRKLPVKYSGRDLSTHLAGGVVKVWDIATERLLSSRSLPGKSGSIAFSPDGVLLGAFSSGYGIKAWNVSTGRVSLTLELGAQRVANDADKGTGPFFCVDARHLVLTMKHALLLGRSVESGSAKRFLPILPHRPVPSLWAIAVSPDGRWFVTGSSSGLLQVWDFKTGELKGSGQIHADDGVSDRRSPNAPRLLTFNREGSRFLAGTEGGAVEVWDAADCHRLRSIQGPKGRVVAAVFLGDRIRVVSGASQRTPFDRDPKTRIYRRDPLLVWEANLGLTPTATHP